MKRAIRLRESELKQMIDESVKRVLKESEFEEDIQQLVNDCVEHILEVKWGDELQSPTEYGVDNIEQDRQFLSKSLYNIIHKIM